ncbi:PEP-utilizing enzyme [Sinomonas soli]
MSMKSFPKPSELPVPAGAEGWEKLYPYYLVFQDKLKEQEDAKFWFCDSQHWPTVFKPFETIGGEFAVKCLGQYNARHLMIPNANGIEFRIHLGYLYMSPIPVPEDQIAARVPDFEERVGYYFQNWPRLLEQWHTKVKGTIDEMEKITFAKPPAIVPIEDIHSGKAKDGSEVLLDNYDRLIQLAYQNWQYHFEFLNLGYIAYLDFFNFCKQVFPNIPDQSIATMVQGVDMELFRPDDELKGLAALAVELGIQSAFENADDADATLGAIRASAGGDHWIQRWEEAHDPWFNFTVGNGFYGHDKYWNEHPEIPLNYIKDYIARLDAGQEILRPVEALIAEKERIVEEYRELLDGDNLAAFDAKRGLAAQCYPYVENHNFYIEHWTMGVFWRKIRELSRVFHAEGFWTQPDDLLYLGRNEVRDALFDLVTWWGVGAAEPIGPSYWPEEIERRRAIVDALKTARPQPALNTPPASITEPFTRMLWGITTEQVQQWLGEGEAVEGGGLRGMAASPGVVEGPARVVTDADQLSEVQQGEILVATVTAPSWGPIFGKIAATVTDIGGMMSHAAIVCREYGLPAVTGTGSGSTTIRTGQMLRVDGTKGTVEILDAAPAAQTVVSGPGAHSHAHGEPGHEHGEHTQEPAHA